MPLLFANPVGFWALLGIPVVLLIHFLQRESRRIPVSTLFLLAHLNRESVKGRRFDRLRQSVPLWLQLLGVLLLTWLLTEPRWTGSQSVQRIVLVLDNSASMEAFREEIRTSLSRELPPLAAVSGMTEYTVIESSVSGANLYRGTSIPDLLEALEPWLPASGSHSSEQALRVGRGLAGGEGSLVFVTDQPGEALPFGAWRLSVGSPLDNVGFTGLRIEEEEGGSVWRATLRNYSENPQSREWFLISGGRRTETRKADLGPGETRVLQGRFPEGADRISLVLASDRFTRDDRLDLVKPVPKPLIVSRTGAPNVEPIIAGLMKSLENTTEAVPGSDPDLWFATYNPLQPAELPSVAIVLLNQEQVPRRFFSGPLVTENDPLMADLDWQGLIARFTPSLPPSAGDTPLLWQGDRPMIFLREEPGKKQLAFNFDVLNANAPRLPAFVILVHRFAAKIRSEKIAVEADNFELRQSLLLAHETGPDAAPLVIVREGGQLTIPLSRSRHLRAPGEPGFFSIVQGDTLLLDAAANFSDTREGDFSKAASVSELGALPGAIRERQTVSDPMRPLWTLLFAAALLVCWQWLGRDSRPEPSPA